LGWSVYLPASASIEYLSDGFPSGDQRRRPASIASQSGQPNTDQVTLDGQAQPVLQNGQWPRLSPDGKRIAYVTAFSTNGQNDLYQAGVDGKILFR